MTTASAAVPRVGRENGERATDAVQASLVADVERMRALLKAHLGGERAPSKAPQPAGPSASPGTDGPVQAITRLFGLTEFERDVLVLAAAAELDGDVAALVAGAQGGGGIGDPRPTFGLALSVLPGAHWDALSPARPLRRWRLVEPGPGPTLASRPLGIDEQVLHTLTGVEAGDGPLAGTARTATGSTALAPAQERVADDLAQAVAGVGAPVLIALDGDDVEARVGVAKRLAVALGRTALLVRSHALPGPGPELAGMARLVDRRALLGGHVPVLVPDRPRAAAAGEQAPLPADAGTALADLLESDLVVVTGPCEAVTGRVLLRRRVALPDPAEQRVLWHRALGTGDGDRASPMEAAVEEVAQHYRLSAMAVESIAREWAAAPGQGAEPRQAALLLRRLCRNHARVSLEGLAERVEVKATWDDLVLPEGQIALLHDLARQVRHRTVVYEEWGFADRAARGLGVTALFAGESGTGKTMAAEVVAADLDLDLYRIDLSAVVSKYIGETEKNLRRLFDAAESSGAILLFDEADALFGKRGEVRDSHDRYANLEVSYLLQRMESYRGLAILTTNLRSNVDRAFLRRLRFVVQFPFPDEGLRTEIWRRAFPARVPLHDIDPAALARMQVPGGTIRAIALGAAFAAADAATAVTPAHVLHAARVEYAKAERPLTATEVSGITGGGA